MSMPRRAGDARGAGRRPRNRPAMISPLNIFTELLLATPAELQEGVQLVDPQERAACEAA